MGKLVGYASSDYWLGTYGRIKQATNVEIESTCGKLLVGEWTYLNIVCAVRVHSRVAAAGGGLRDKNGEWILGYNKYLVKSIHGSVLKTLDSALIRTHCILSQESSWLLRYIPREQNQSADFIAKLAFGEKEYLQLIKNPLEAVSTLIKADKEKNLCNPFSNPIT
ncbi:hypothetical protein Gohar_027795 [Gossypium harknessii]|uniref:RNase H type-1 domain-containing protein n=1 Tax=Gossypium harknessii TaxID=34285 RepID=A0A7J9I897_9ROSI|nr:hypothetical protein [Gossypium harknessii]